MWVLEGTSDVLKTTVHRQDAELWQLQDLLQKVDRKGTPTLASTNQSDVQAFLTGVLSSDKLSQSTPLHDFLSLNVSSGQLLGNPCKEFKFFTDGMTGFIDTLRAKLPAFAPEYQLVNQSNFFDMDETPLECWVYTKATQVGLTNIELAYALNFNYSNACPAYAHPSDDHETYAVDVAPPGYAGAPFAYPEQYLDYPVHFQPSGYVNGHNVRLEYTSADKFYFDTEENIREWITKVHVQEDHDRLKPLQILEIGASTGLSTLIYADMFPNANVTGLELSAPFVRFCRERQVQWKKDNAQFFHGNAEHMPYFADNTFDIVSYTLVLHEGTAQTDRNILKELLRVLKPGGRMSGFEVAYLANPLQRAQVEFFTTFGPIGAKDYEKVGFHGPEPFMKEFQTLNLPKAVPEAGYVNTSYHYIDVFEGTYVGYKPF